MKHSLQNSASCLMITTTVFSVALSMLAIASTALPIDVQATMVIGLPLILLVWLALVAAMVLLIVVAARKALLACCDEQ